MIVIILALHEGTRHIPVCVHQNDDKKTYATSKSRATLYFSTKPLDSRCQSTWKRQPFCDVSEVWHADTCMYIYIHIQLYKYMEVSKDGDTPRSCILMRFSIRHHPLWGTPIKVCLPPCHWQLPIKWNLHILGHRGRQTLAIQVDSSHWMKLCLSESGNKRCVDYSTFWSSFTQIPISNHSFALIPRVQKWPCSN